MRIYDGGREVGQAVVVKSAQAWLDQANAAYATLAAKLPEGDHRPLRELAALDRVAFGQLIEAMVALGAEADDEVRALAGLRPVGEVLGIGR